MAHPSDIVIGLDVGPRAITGVAATLEGEPLADVRVANPLTFGGTEGGSAPRAEHDMGAVFTCSVRAIRRLAERVPDLARRARAMGVSGGPGGTWLIDEDGDPLGPAMLGIDTRAAEIIRRWESDGTAARLRALTGFPPSAALQSAQLTWLKAHEPERLHTAAAALSAKGWLLHCLTGTIATEVSEAIPAFGNPEGRGYDHAVLDVIGADDLAPLLPPLGVAGEIGMAASAASGLVEGMPVHLAPASPYAAALTAGLAPGAGNLGLAVLDDEAAFLVPCSDLAALRSQPTGPAGVVPAPFDGVWYHTLHSPDGLTCLDWVIDLAEQILADSGLIGVGRADLSRLFAEKVVSVPPSRTLLHPWLASIGGLGEADGAARGQITGLARATSLYDVMRGAYGGIGLRTRAAFDALRGQPDAIRTIGARGDPAFLHAAIAACLELPVQPIRVPSAGVASARGAALVAAVAIDPETGLDQTVRSWSEPLLGDVVPPDPGLAAPWVEAAGDAVLNPAVRP